MAVRFALNGVDVAVDDDGVSLLEALRDRLRVRSPKDGCSPQGQCGCCTVLVDGRPRVACVTALRRVEGRSVTTIEGLPDAASWADAFCATGASQCGFCTPGIIMRLASVRAAGGGASDAERALLAHLCRCTGWRTITEAYEVVAHADADAPGAGPHWPRDLDGASRRASIEGRTAQRVAPEVALGGAGFADDMAPPDALVAVRDANGDWAVGETLAEARAAAAKVQGRRTTRPAVPPLAVPPGRWDATLRTSWTEPAYLELDASWCLPGGEPATPLANGGAFGGKRASVVAAAARQLADTHGRPVRVLLSREDAVRIGPKRPPVAGGASADGTGVLRVVRTPGIAAAVGAVAPRLRVEEVAVAGPPTAAELRAAGWAEATVLLAGARGSSGEVRSPEGAVASASVSGGRIVVRVACGDPLDDVVLRSYCVGAAHMAYSWVTSESLAVDDEGVPHDLTIRSFGIVRAQDMPAVDVGIEADDGPPVNGSDAVFAAVAAAVWLHGGCRQDWPTGDRLVP